MLHSPFIKESVPLLLGKGIYFDDINLPETLHIAFVRSPYAHAKIIEIDSEIAAGMPGVVAIFTGEQINSQIKPLSPPLTVESYQPTDWFPLATSKVIYAGEPVAVVVAIDRYCAEDAAEMVFADLEPIDVVMANAHAALAADARPIHPELASNTLLSVQIGESMDNNAFGAADVHVSGTFQHPRVHTLPIEPRGLLAQFNPDTNELTTWSSTQIPHILQTLLSNSLNHPAEKIRVIAPNVGGGFGLKSSCYPEEILVPYLAKKLGRPVKWTQDRLEALQAGSHARDITVEATLAADEKGQIIGMQAKAICDIGAYHVFPYSAGVDVYAIGYSLPGPYDFPFYSFEGIAVATNKCTVGAYRGVGSVLGPIVMEGLLNQLAQKLGKDPLELRQRNLARPDKFPFHSPAGSIYDSGNYPALLDLAIEESGYPELRQHQQKHQSDKSIIGVGLTCFTESTATNSSVFKNRGLGSIVAGFDAAILSIDAQGNLNGYVSTPSQGQGQQTTFAQLVAQEMEIPADRINIHLGDTATTPYGSGTFASRSLVSGGGALIKAADQLKYELLKVGSRRLKLDLAKVAYTNGVVFNKDDSAVRISLNEFGGLKVEAVYDPPPGVVSGAIHIVMVEIERSTGKVTIPKYVVAQDCGRVLNQKVVDGQIRGGIVQGIGTALYEELHYDDQGQMLSGSLMDYMPPTSAESPNIEIVYIETPSPNTEGGYKGVAESGIIGAPAAITHAILDAIGASPEHVQLPLTPERVLALIQAAQ